VRGASVERVQTQLCAVGESPLWAPDERAWYWVDIPARRLHRFDGRQESSWVLPGQPGSIALHDQGGLVCAMEDRIVRLLPENAPSGHGLLDMPLSPQPQPLATVNHPLPGMRFNDGRCDRAGRFWVGSMVMDMAAAEAAGALYRFAARPGAGTLNSKRCLDKLIVPNGLAFSPSGDILYLSDSHPDVRRIWAFDLSPSGEPLTRRMFVDMAQQPGRPDGAAVDGDGCYWTCANDGGCLLRFTPQGRLDRTIELPVSKPAMCAFGGPWMDDLLITTIRPASRPAHEEDLAGAVFICRPGVQGLRETPLRTQAAEG
jgi:sugar lactone lactonase YvrE